MAAERGEQDPVYSDTCARSACNRSGPPVCRFSRHPLGRLRWAVVHQLGQVRREQRLRLRLLPGSLPRCRRAGKMQRTNADGLQRRSRACEGAAERVAGPRPLPGVIECPACRPCTNVWTGSGGASSPSSGNSPYLAQSVASSQFLPAFLSPSTVQPSASSALVIRPMYLFSLFPFAAHCHGKVVSEAVLQDY
jgi:hypothetical protein